VWSVERVIAPSPASELWTEVRTLDLIELLNPTPGLIACRPRYIDF